MLAASIFSIFWIVKRNLRGFIVFMAVFKVVNVNILQKLQLLSYKILTIVVKLGEKVKKLLENIKKL